MDKKDIVVIGASAGGVEALMRLCRGLPPDLPAAVLVAQHMAHGSPSVLARVLARSSTLPVSAAVDGEALQHGRIYVSVPDRHLLLRRDTILVRRGPRENHTRPAINALFRSAAIAYGARVVGVVLTGSLDDGTDGLIDIKRAGGTCIVQSPDEAAWPSMPQQALKRDHVDHVVDLGAMPRLLSELVRQPAGRSQPLPEQTLIEDRIAAEDAHAPTPGTPSPGDASVISCPDCGGVLNETEPGSLRFRCQIGHAFTSKGLVASQRDELERALDIAVRTHREREAMFLRLQHNAAAKGDTDAEQRWSDAAEQAQKLAATLAQALAELDDEGDAVNDDSSSNNE